MIAPSSAWVRVGLRRMPNTPSRNTGNTSSNLERARLRLHPSNASRRYNSTTPEGGQTSATTARTIPGPSWLWLDPIVEPFRAYGRVQQRRPYMTQLVSSLIIYFIGDCVAQSITRPEPSAQQEKASEADETDEKGWVQQWSDDRDWSRTMRALAIGGLSAIPSYRWFLWLSHSFNYRSKTLSLSIKVFINQAFFTPLFNSYFFGMQTLLSGGTFPEIIERIKNTVPTSWWNSCKIWPAVTAFSFSYVPIQYRSIFGGVVAIGWQTYLNLLNQQAAAEEELERAAGHVAPANVMTVHTNAHHGQAMEKCAA